MDEKGRRCACDFDRLILLEKEEGFKTKLKVAVIKPGKSGIVPKCTELERTIFVQHSGWS